MCQGGGQDATQCPPTIDGMVPMSSQSDMRTLAVSFPRVLFAQILGGNFEWLQGTRVESWLPPLTPQTKDWLFFFLIIVTYECCRHRFSHLRDKKFSLFYQKVTISSAWKLWISVLFRFFFSSLLAGDHGLVSSFYCFCFNGHCHHFYSEKSLLFLRGETPTNVCRFYSLSHFTHWHFPPRGRLRAPDSTGASAQL